MFARTTMAELDPVRMSVDDAVRVFKESVIPALHKQDGYEGSYVFVASEGGAKTIALNAADEVAVAAFLDGKIAFNDIPRTIEQTLVETPDRHPESIKEVLEVDAESRRTASRLAGRPSHAKVAG